MSIERPTNNSHEWTSDEDIERVADLLDTFPFYISGGKETGPGDGLIRTPEYQCLMISGIDSYRKVWFSRTAEPGVEKVIFRLDQYVGWLPNESTEASTVVLNDPEAAALLADTDEKPDLFENLERDFAKDDLIEHLSAVAKAMLCIKPSADLSYEDAEYFRQKYPFFHHLRGMALMDVIFAEYELGKPVFYGLVERPLARDLADLEYCLLHGDIIHGKDTPNSAEFSRALQQ